MLSHLKMMQDPENQDDFSFDAPGVPGVPGVRLMHLAKELTKLRTLVK